MRAKSVGGFMKTIVLLLAFCGVAFGATTAREYYKELYKAGGLDRMADVYACFPDEDTNGVFMIFSKSDTLRQYLINEGQYQKLPKAQRDELDKGFIYVRTYLKGIANDTATFGKDGDSYLFEGDYKQQKGIVFKLRYSFNWTTLRYRFNVSAYKNSNLDPGNVHDVFGRCELIPTDVKQTGN
jgi:hypothetical protein